VETEEGRKELWEGRKEAAANEGPCCYHDLPRGGGVKARQSNQDSIVR
jgi:hypothetical protein